jgi:hypothetical protein
MLMIGELSNAMPQRRSWGDGHGGLGELCLTATSLNRVQIRPYARAQWRVVS